MARLDRRTPKRHPFLRDRYADPSGRPWCWEEPSQQMGHEHRFRGPGLQQFN